ncbi:MAG: hypothetical protein IJD69_00760 [Alphaproteobacteria bacterium]|nr:hypothetical protein [Alphaproteobacteria bacterium]
MNKLFLPTVTVIIMLCEPAIARFIAGDNNTCFVDTHKRNEFWYCGTHSDTKCGGKKLKNRHDRHWIYHGGKFTHDGKNYWCCNGSYTATGHFVQTSSWISNKIITVQLANGTCNYTQKINACGDEESTPCTTPDTCTNGQILRNGTCVAPCAPAHAFESTTSNTCIACPETKYSGIAKNDTCIQCNPEHQFFDRTSKQCIEKNTLTAIPAKVLKKCYGCDNNDFFKTCVKIFNSATKEQSTHPEYINILKHCHISPTDN